MELIETIREILSNFFFCGARCQQQLRQFDLLFSSLLVILSLLVSLYNARNHMCNYSNPQFQDKIIIILFMSPFYSICSYLGIAYTEYTEYINLVRDIYEAFLLFTFFYLIFAYLAYSPETQEILDIKVYSILTQQQPNEVHHVCPFSLLSKPYKLNDVSKAKYFVYRCKRFILQFLVIKPLSSFLLIPLAAFQMDSLVWFIGWVVCISISLSLYYLVLFYHALKKPLARFNPLMKFLTIKITLFFTFWQKIFLLNFREEILHNFDQTIDNFNEDKVMFSLENSLVCVEMFVMAIAAGYAYTYKDFVSEDSKTANICQIIKNNWHYFLVDFRLIKPKKFGFKTNEPVQNDFVIHERDRFSSYVKRQFDVEMVELNSQESQQSVHLKHKLIESYL